MAERNQEKRHLFLRRFSWSSALKLFFPPEATGINSPSQKEESKQHINSRDRSTWGGGGTNVGALDSDGMKDGQCEARQVGMQLAPSGGQHNRRRVLTREGSRLSSACVSCDAMANRRGPEKPGQQQQHESEKHETSYTSGTRTWRPESAEQHEIPEQTTWVRRPGWGLVPHRDPHGDMAARHCDYRSRDEWLNKILPALCIL